MSTLPVNPVPETDAAKRVLPPRPKAAALVALSFTLLLYLVELVDVILPGDLDQGGIHSRVLSGLDGVLFAPLLHAGWSHLFANTVPVLVFSFLAMAAGIGRFALVTAIIWVVSGLGVWLIGPANAVTVGASGLAFGWLAYLLVRGIFNRAAGQILVAVVLLGVWSGMLVGLLPGNPGVSWQGHVFGALAGVLAAWLTSRTGKSRKAVPAAPGNLEG
ncbi:rhomboid family intramembrane serine protease [Amycolatopsis mongoliensis]|uniref:Rhomboid family intramembrane serine protease n=1 Tax=Amycolatopsis mongoliensis TaxID=715475 RepID=A0A9Y2K071_9PSEU|nr:rhomboid family intramembrane serine protease [Amycolatopsis sp. 4-36]WIY06184.1 rhomboid family intramembrane serine protease [Amycolatopsis sp. 4-36]